MAPRRKICTPFCIEDCCPVRTMLGCKMERFSEPECTFRPPPVLHNSLQMVRRQGIYLRLSKTADNSPFDRADSCLVWQHSRWACRNQVYPHGRARCGAQSVLEAEVLALSSEIKAPGTKANEGHSDGSYIVIGDGERIQLRSLHLYLRQPASCAANPPNVGHTCGPKTASSSFRVKLWIALIGVALATAVGWMIGLMNVP